MRLAKTGTLSLSLKSRPLPRERTVHEILSDLQRAYSVFVPASDDFFNLFQLILLHPDRPRSPRNTIANLRKVVTRLPYMPGLGYDANLVDAFREQFEKVGYRKIFQPPTTFTVSDESLRGAGLTIATPGPRLGINASRSRTTHRQLRLSKLSSDAYTGGTALRRLIWEHAEPVFLLLLEELETEVSQVGDRSLLGVITKRHLSNVGVSRTDQKGASAMVSMQHGVDAQCGGAASRMFHETYDDLYGVSGLHFILFPVECLGWHQWRVYRGIDVCDSELDESDSPDALQRNNLYQAGLWLQGTGNLNHATRDGHKSVRDDARMDSTTNTRSGGIAYERRPEDQGHINITGVHRTAPFVKIDARPFLSELAMNRCKLAATYRKTSTNKSDMAFQAVCLLRGVLRKGLFESTIRAMYDLSGCYLKGIGVEEDKSMARFLRYCASGLRRSYGKRTRWSKRFVTEIGFRRDQEPEQRIRVIWVLSRRSLISLDYSDGKSIIPPSLRDKEAFRNEWLDAKGDIVSKNDEMEVCDRVFNLHEMDSSLLNYLSHLSDKETKHSQSAVSKRTRLHGRNEREIKRVKRETKKEEGVSPQGVAQLVLLNPLEVLGEYFVKMKENCRNNIGLGWKSMSLLPLVIRSQLAKNPSSVSEHFMVEETKKDILSNIGLENNAMCNVIRLEKLLKKPEEALEAMSTKQVSAARSVQNAKDVAANAGMRYRRGLSKQQASFSGQDDASNAQKRARRRQTNRESAAVARDRRVTYTKALEAELVRMEKAHDAYIANFHILLERNRQLESLQNGDTSARPAADLLQGVEKGNYDQIFWAKVAELQSSDIDKPFQRAAQQSPFKEVVSDPVHTPAMAEDSTKTHPSALASSDTMTD